jgi:hypothetical protein
VVPVSDGEGISTPSARRRASLWRAIFEGFFIIHRNAVVIPNSLLLSTTAFTAYPQVREGRLAAGTNAPFLNLSTRCGLPAPVAVGLEAIRENRPQMGFYGAPDERRDLQSGQIRHPLYCDTGSFVEFDVLWPVVTHNVEQ